MKGKLILSFLLLFVTVIAAFENKQYWRRTDAQPTTCDCQVYSSIPTTGWAKQCGLVDYYGRIRFYRKVAYCYGIPVLSSATSSDKAVQRYCYMVKFMLADRADVRKRFFQYCGRTAVIAQSEGTTHIPEHSFLGSSWNQRARGLGGTMSRPVSSAGEENLLCLANDRYRVEDIGLHEFVHGIVNLGTTMRTEIQAAYRNAKYRGLWSNTYADDTWEEYFAEGAQSFFNTNPAGYTRRGNGIHNDINTRPELKTYDPTLYNLVKKLWPCQNYLKNRCTKDNSVPTLKRDCDGSGTGTTDKGTGGTDKGGDCSDSRTSCPGWAKNGECEKNADWMLENCKKSCKSKSCTEKKTDPPATSKPVTEKPVTEKPGSCDDIQDFCPFVKTYCTSNTWVKVNCRKSCNLCPKPLPPKPRCQDKNPSCPEWSKAGYCVDSDYENYMKKTCFCACA